MPDPKQRGTGRSLSKIASEVDREHPAFGHLLEDVFTLKLFPTKRSVRAIKKEDGEVMLISQDVNALREVASALANGARITAKRIKNPTQEELARLLDDGTADMPRLLKE